MNSTEIAVINKLLTLRRAGNIAAVYCNACNLSVHFPDGKIIGPVRPERYSRLLRAVQRRTKT